jgi:protein-S-isoprenylcysteine O-methyltransferase Ste14
MSRLELRIPPVALVLVAGSLMWLLAWAFPGLAVELPARTGVAIVLALAGIGTVVAGVLQFRKSRTTVNPMNPGASSALVVGGVYRVTRNPMYLGFAIALLGWAVFLANPLALLVLPVFTVYMTRFQILPEERVLEARFGADFKAYAAKVRRWL